MDPSLRVVTRIPLMELWTDRGPLPATRGRWLGADDVRDLLRAGPVRLVIADVGHRLVWVADADRFAVWKEEVRSHLVDPRERGFRLEDFPGRYAYLASEWYPDAPGSAPIVSLEKHH